MNRSADAPRVSIIIPVRNEAGNIVPVLTEIETVLAALAPFEVICVDDGSTDATAAEIAGMRAGRPWLRNIRLALTCGKAAAIRAGVGERGPTSS